MQKTTKLYSGSQNTGSPYDPTRSGSLCPSRPILAPASMPDPAFSSLRHFLALQAVRQYPLYSVCADRWCLVSRGLHGRLVQRMQQLCALLNPNYSFRNFGHAVLWLHQTRGAPSDTPILCSRGLDECVSARALREGLLH
jgi:hypothetical protein